MGPDLRETDHRVNKLERDRDRISRMITEAGDVYRNRNEELARELISEGDVLQDEFDDLVHALVTADVRGSEAVPRALFYRHLKRIVAHLMNVMTAVVMPLDKLDYFDEDPQDRPSRDDAG